jgi:hypothetical protein
MKTIGVNGLTVTNAFDVKGQAIVALIKQYINGFNTYYGFRTLGVSTEKVSFPACFVDPSDQSAVMITTGKYHVRLSYDIIFYVMESSPEGVVTLATSGMEALIKLFSNNALGDLGGAGTNSFKAYSPYWIDSEMKNMRISRTFQNPGPAEKDVSMVRVGWMQLEVQDVLVK